MCIFAPDMHTPVHPLYQRFPVAIKAEGILAQRHRHGVTGNIIVGLAAAVLLLSCSISAAENTMQTSISAVAAFSDAPAGNWAAAAIETVFSITEKP
jgi:hypothetical protein